MLMFFYLIVKLLKKQQPKKHFKEMRFQYLLVVGGKGELFLLELASE